MVKVFRYCSGYRGVVSPCTITGYTPAPVTEDAPNLETPQTGVDKNGAMLDVGKTSLGPQGFTSRTFTSTGLPYSEPLNVGRDLPLIFSAGEEGSLTTTTFKEDAGDKGTPSVSARHILTVVNAANEPPAGAFRPAPAADSKASTHVESDMIDLSTLPSLSMPGKPSWLQILKNLRWDQAVEYGNGSRYWRVMPESHSYYVWKIRGVARVVSDAVLFLLSDAPNSEKRDIAVALCQHGIDLKARAEKILATGDSDWGGVNGSSGLGGVNIGHEKLALLVAGVLFNDTAMINVAADNRMFGEDGNTQYVTQQMIDEGVNVPFGVPPRPFAQYIQDDLGKPEWSVQNIINSPALQGNRLINATYRAEQIRPRVTASLAIQLWPALYNAYPAITRDPFLDYADLLMERDFYKSGASDPAGNNVFQYARTWGGTTKETKEWVINAWDAYRTANGQTAVWDFPV